MTAGRTLMAGAAAAVSTATLATVGARPGISYLSASPALFTLSLLAAVALLAGWWTRDRLLPNSTLLLAALLAVPELAAVAALDPVLRTAADALSIVLAAVAVAVVAGGCGVATRLIRIAVIVASVGAAARAWLVDPFLDVRCRRFCAPNPLAWAGWDTAGRMATIVAVAVVGVTGAVVAAELVRGRRSPAVMLAGVAMMAGTVGTAALRFVFAEPVTGPLFSAAVILLTGGAAALGTLVAGSSLREGLAHRLLRHRVTALAYAMRQVGSPGALARAMGDALGEPSLVVRYAADGGWVDETGRPAHLPAADTVTVVQRAGTPIAALAQAGRVDDRKLAVVLGPATRLALENDQLAAAALAGLRAVEDSRTRLVEAAALERHRLERDLHDGAQQSLVALSLGIGMLSAHATDVETRALVDRASAGTRAAVEDLRRVARGLYPAMLADGGIAAALAELAESSTAVPVRLDVQPGIGRLPRGVETTAYLVASAALAEAVAAGAAEFMVCADVRDALILTAYASPTGASDCPSALDALGDAAAGLRGTLVVERRPGSLRAHLELPCSR